MLIAEISDKMFSAGELATMAIVGTVFCVAVVRDRMIAPFIFCFALLIGCFFTYIAFHAAFLEGAFSDSVWKELGLSWVMVAVAMPMLPAIAVFSRMIFCSRKSGGGF
jgi:hypothetical protein